MASMGGGPLDAEPVLRLVKSSRMLNKQLQDICKSESIRCTNLKKADLQARIEERLLQYRDTGNAEKFNKLAKFIRDQAGAQGGAGSQSLAGSPNGHLGAPAMPHRNFQHQQMLPSAVAFKPNPFYQIREQIGLTRTCEPMAAHRNNIVITIRAADYPALQTLEDDRSLKVMVFCAGDNRGFQDISFPHQSEIKVNGAEIKANLRGLKNKPGSTRPVDITRNGANETILRLTPIQYENRVEFTYALTTKAGLNTSQKFYLVLNLVQAFTVEELKKKVEAGNRLSKESVITDMVSKAADPDIEATSMVLSLKCPISTLRMDTPVRASSCRHNQCFDVTSYLQMQEQAPTWLCPICNNAAPFSNLVVDEFVLDILKNTPKSLEQITIEPDGKWSTAPKAASATPAVNGNGKRKRDFVDSDDDLIEISDFDGNRPAPALRQPSLASNSYAADTPPFSIGDSREPSHMGSTPRPAAPKPAAQTIDLTLDSDDDEEPIQRAPKRPSVNSLMAQSPSGYLSLPATNGLSNGSYSM